MRHHFAVPSCARTEAQGPELRPQEEAAAGLTARAESQARRVKGRCGPALATRAPWGRGAAAAQHVPACPSTAGGHGHACWHPVRQDIPGHIPLLWAGCPHPRSQGEWQGRCAWGPGAEPQRPHERTASPEGFISALASLWGGDGGLTLVSCPPGALPGSISPTRSKAAARQGLHPRAARPVDLAQSPSSAQRPMGHLSRSHPLSQQLL